VVSGPILEPLQQRVPCKSPAEAPVKRLPTASTCQLFPPYTAVDSCQSVTVEVCLTVQIETANKPPPVGRFPSVCLASASSLLHRGATQSDPLVSSHPRPASITSPVPRFTNPLPLCERTPSDALLWLRLTASHFRRTLRSPLSRSSTCLLAIASVPLPYHPFFLSCFLPLL
jgi:hypothetical protein